MKMLKQNMREKTENMSRNLGGAAETVERIESKLFIQGWWKFHCTKKEQNLPSKNSIAKYEVIIN